MVTHTVTTETVKYCSPGVFSYTAFFTVYFRNNKSADLGNLVREKRSKNCSKSTKLFSVKRAESGDETRLMVAGAKKYSYNVK